MRFAVDHVPVDRVSSNDLTQLATDVGPVAMNVGALLVLAADGAAPQRLRATLAERVMAIPRMRQRLEPVPRGLGRPVWVDVTDFDPRIQIRSRSCPAPGDRAALLDLATSLVIEPLPRDRPLWRAAIVTGLADGGCALVVVLHHVLADGIGGLAMLATLADPAGDSPPVSSAEGGSDGHPGRPDRPARRPSTRSLAEDRLAESRRSLRATAKTLHRLGAARRELGHAPAAPRTSLNRATGPRRHVEVVDTDLAEIRSVAHRLGATVNDVLLVATTAAMLSILDQRGERVPALVVSVPISTRTSTTTDNLGNEVGVMPVTVPVTGALPDRLAQVAQATAARRGQARGSSAALIGPAFRALARLHVFGWFVDRQRLVNTFLTNLRGPGAPVSLAGAPIRAIVPITVTAGNVTVAFAALSYDGTLTVSVITDPDRVPEHRALALALDRHLAALIAAR